MVSIEAKALMCLVECCGQNVILAPIICILFFIVSVSCMYLENVPQTVSKLATDCHLICDLFEVI